MKGENYGAFREPQLINLEKENVNRLAEHCRTDRLSSAEMGGVFLKQCIKER
jgi:hypothetical protein